MTLKSDSKGFLIADSAADVSELAQGIDGVRSDTSAILSILKKSANSGTLQRAKVSNPNVTNSAAVRSRSGGGTGSSAVRDPASGRFMKAATKPATEMAKAVNSLTRQQASKSAEEKRAETARASRGEDDKGQARDIRGRFGAGGVDGDGGKDKGDKDGLFSRLKDSLSKGGTNADMEKVDPLIEAGNELSRIASGPMRLIAAVGKPLIGRRGKDGGDKNDKSVPWFRRLFGELRFMRKQDSEFGKAEVKALKEIEKKDIGGGSGGSTGGIGGVLGGLLSKGGGLLGGLLRNGGGLLAGLGRGLGKGLLRRVPLIGALLSGGSALASIFGKDDPTKSAEQNRKDRFTGGGAGIGALIGGGLGLLGGPVGAIVGGMIGDKVGEMVGAWLSTVDWKDVGDKITAAWDGAVKLFRDLWTPISDKLGIVADSAKKIGPALERAAEATNKAVKTATGVDVKQTTAKAVETGNAVLEKLSPTYRHKTKFAGINGGDGLANFGTYTNAEAEKISQLKSSGANTSANLKGGMPKHIQEKIIAQANAAGLDPAMMLKKAAMESGGNPNAISSTGAVGVYQFTGRTATGVGIKNRFNEDENIAGGMALTKQNIAYLKSKRIPVTAESLYMMHQLGPKAAKEVLVAAKNPDRSIESLTPATQEAIAKNYGSGVKTAAEYVKKNGNALTTRADSAIGKSEAGYLPTAAVAAPSIPSATASLPAVSAAPAPAAPPAIRAPSVSVPAAHPVPPTAQANIPVPMNSKQPMQVVVTNDRLANQDVRDRRLAQIATGGMAN